MGKNSLTSCEFTKFEREFYMLNIAHLELYEQDGNFPCGRQNRIVNPADSLVSQVLHGR